MSAGQAPSAQPYQSQESGPPEDSSNDPRTRRCFKPRLVIAMIQAFIGVILVVCGAVLVGVSYPEGESPESDDSANTVLYNEDAGDGRDDTDKQLWGIWIGLLTVGTSVFGFLSKRNLSLMKVYMVFAILDAIVSFILGFIAAYLIGRTSSFRDELLDRSGEISLFFDPCYHRPGPGSGTTVNPLVQLRYDVCIESHLRAARIQLPFYYIMFVSFVVNFVVAILAIGFTWKALDCCCYHISCTRSKPDIMVEPQALTGPVNTHDPPPSATEMTNPAQQTCANQHSPHDGAPSHDNLPLPRVPLEQDNGGYYEPDILRRDPLPTPRQQQVVSNSLEPSVRRPGNNDTAYLEPDAIGKNQSDEYPYVYADQREERFLDINREREQASSNEDKYVYN